MTSKSDHFLNYAILTGVCLCSALTVSAVPVTFQVDMSYQTAAGNFNPTNGVVTARGAFQAPAQWVDGFVLTNSVANTNLYTGTYDVAGSAGTVFEYKFVYNNNDTTGDKWEGRSNRSFTQTSSSQVLPVVLYNDELPNVNVDVTFQVDMSIQIANGKFIPGTDIVEARGSFQSPNTWSSGFVLTNSLANPNLYRGTYTITNTPGNGLVYYKFWASGVLAWEGVSDRSFNLPASATTLPAVYFNNDNGSATPVTFRIDMTPQVSVGNFTPGADYVEARGGFNNWLGGFTLTNDPAAPNSNLFSGTYMIAAAPGTGIEYKYVVNGGSGPLAWEQPVSTFGNNRSFALSANPQILPTVFFNDLGSHDLLAVDTLVTFRVNMAGAVGTDAHAFNPAVDTVWINGDFLGWWGWGAPPAANQLYETSPGSYIFTNTFLRPAGAPLGVNYKYSINGTDNEAPFGQNHIRQIRSVGSYTMPLDTFGNMVVEPAVGSLTIAPPSGGSVLISWLGRPGVHLQSKTTLAPGPWVDHPATEGLSSTNWPISAGTTFFRLVKPGN
jgi:hypothetical protein